MAIKTGRGADQFMVRFPPNMRDLIRDTADVNGRSMNAEIVTRLEQSFARGGGWSAEDIIRRLTLALDAASGNEEKASARFQALTYLAGAALQSAKTIKAWEHLRPTGSKRERLNPMEQSEIDRTIDAMIQPEIEQLVFHLRAQGWIIEAPEDDDIQ